MARVTVEDCVTKIPNRFELVMLSAQRARDISAGSALNVDRDNDKNPVVALREIADEAVELGELEESLVKGLQNYIEIDEPEDEELDLLAVQQEAPAAEGDSAEPVMVIEGAPEWEGGLAPDAFSDVVLPEGSEA